ncbi:hypothetical protein RHSIM_Rhsim04G0034300 [Rhododendron simsii]|uniref:Uncharacterized protein n=1 Tax=Rhododendron simsii TaxID=118357 RepID=A0A834LR89_RHOSS|nr:hypothetical protein RHSIM_Rhsim04G0034300 [Rhododendron simsii]
MEEVAYFKEAMAGLRVANEVIRVHQGWRRNAVRDLNRVDLVVASARDDKKISLWRKNGESVGTIPMACAEAIHNIESNMEISQLDLPNLSNLVIQIFKLLGSFLKNG